MTDLASARAGLLREIRERPERDDLRLVFADLLDDEGRGDQAAWVRACLALAACKTPPCVDWGEGPRDLICERCGWCRAWLNVHPWSLTGPPGKVMPRPLGEIPAGLGFGYWRGLVEAWAIPDVATFEARHREVFAEHPIRRVALRCGVFDVLTLCRNGNPRLSKCDVTSWELWRCLKARRKDGHVARYASTEDCLADLQVAMVRCGRLAHGLPALEGVR